MLRYVLRKSLSWLIVIFLATNLTYLIASTFLDPSSNYLGRRPPLSEEQIDRILTPLNLSTSTPLWERWWHWFTGILLHWDWGTSPVGDSVNSQVSYRIWVSAELLLLATIISIVLGVAIGVYTASRQYQLGDRVFQGISIVALNLHVVVVSIAVVFFGRMINDTTGKRIFYVTGSANPDVHGFFPHLVDLLQHLLLPTIALVVISYAGYHMTQRSLLLDNLGADYVRTARAKGLTRPQAIRKHALRTSVIPIATSVAFSIPGIFTGAVMTEQIFGWNGMGQYFVQTISKNDVHGAVAVGAFGALMTGLSAILADILIVILDPRVRVN
ncbi:ABC transporter permease [Corynebacterium heidelbergense]|uniref:ABC transporter permease n=1 Tax=Corynebacterium heidelbergense TaxID=2055947 RepID=A0A364V8U5_9CORY|nr:ABC transporter permease [Corynebacterium heidelbergense]RAV33080.1 ABC transporter permease [Corynebacterium heidelbergense]WCZ36506.1 Dipeptide transport system permease protein DppB [Corynebacterium heidelbergense]